MTRKVLFGLLASMLILGAVSNAGAQTVVNLSTLTEDYTAQDGDIMTGTLSGNYQISVAADATVMLSNVSINGTNSGNFNWAGITCLGNATLILSGQNTVRGFYEDYPGIKPADTGILTIQGDGSLFASSNGYACGIGNGYGDGWNCGHIVIAGGTITATGGDNAAGIGSGYNNTCGNITISGGTIIATGGTGSCGIGSAYDGHCGAITITTGIVSVTATKSEPSPNCIGAGERGTCDTIIIDTNLFVANDGNTCYISHAVLHRVSFAVNPEEGGMINHNGTPAISGLYVEGSTLSLSAVPSCGYRFDHWSTEETTEEINVTVDSAMTLTAFFAIIPPDTVTVHDTTTITEYVHDTIFVGGNDTVTEYVHDTTTVTELVHDTITFTEHLIVHDTITLTEHMIVHDTVILAQYWHDTIVVMEQIHDTITVTDYIYVHDTIRLTDYIHDTIFLHDTVYVGVDDVDALDAKIYANHGQIVVDGAEQNTVTLFDVRGRILATRQEQGEPLRFDVPATGTYLVKIGRHAARKIVVVK